MGVAIPTLMLYEFKFVTAGCKDAEEFFRFPHIGIAVKNYGQSPAFLKNFVIVFAQGKLQPKPIYSFPYPCDTEDVVDAGHPRALTGEELKSALPTPDWAIRNFIAGTDHLIVYGYVCYGDIFGSPLRYMKFSKQLLEFNMDQSKMLVMDCGGYEYTGQHEDYDASPNQPQKPN